MQFYSIKCEINFVNSNLSFTFVVYLCELMLSRAPNVATFNKESEPHGSLFLLHVFFITSYFPRLEVIWRYEVKL